ncbi:MAG: hypothetical protein NTY34_02770 [Candidatus Omnitrophica bacterium]|nr:hypothetical protein [Candidatus Omnitrophota bacterium]
MKIEKDVLSIETTTKKEATRMIKKCLAVTLAALIVIFNVLPAQAYQELPTPVSISATGTLTGTTIAFTATLVTQESGSPISPAVAPFETVTNPTTLSDSGAALKITGGTNEATGRILIFTDNGSLLGDVGSPVTSYGKPDPSTGADGAGMVGTSISGYQVPMMWGVKSAAPGDPNTNMDYVFPTPADFNSGIGAVYIVDKRHTHSYAGTSNTPYASNPAPFNTAAGMDANAMWSVNSTAAVGDIANPASATGKAGLYPQSFYEDYYSAPKGTVGRAVVSQALYKNIATIAFGMTPNIDTATPTKSSYVCNVPNLSTAAYDDSVTAKLAKCEQGDTDNYLYVYIGADFRTSPAQAYSTTKLCVAMIKD